MPTADSSANPLPSDAEHAPAIQTTDSANVNPIHSESVSKSASPSGSDDLLVPAVGYVFWLAALLALMGQNAKAKFHGAQALLYGVIILALYVPVLIVTGMLGFAGGVIGGLVGLLVLVAYVGIMIFAVPIYMAYATHQGKDVLLPVIGKFVAEKIGYRV